MNLIIDNKYCILPSCSCNRFYIRCQPYTVFIAIILENTSFTRRKLKSPIEMLHFLQMTESNYYQIDNLNLNMSDYMNL